MSERLATCAWRVVPARAQHGALYMPWPRYSLVADVEDAGFSIWPAPDIGSKKA